MPTGALGKYGRMIGHHCPECLSLGAQVTGAPVSHTHFFPFYHLGESRRARKKGSDEGERMDKEMERGGKKVKPWK